MKTDQHGQDGNLSSVPQAAQAVVRMIERISLDDNIYRRESISVLVS